MFEEVKEMEERESSICPQCKKIAMQAISTPGVDTIFKPRWYYNIAQKPVYVTSRKHLTKICNVQGNYSNFPLTKMQEREIKQPVKKEKRKVMRELEGR